MKEFLILIVIVHFGAGAAAFRDLNFDDANTNSINTYGPVSSLMPGWNLYTTAASNSPPDAFVFLNSGDRFGVDSPAIYSIEKRVGSDPNVTKYLSAPYMLSLEPMFIFGGGGDGLQVHVIQIAQTGDIPQFASSLRFVCWGDPFDVLIGGRKILVNYQMLASAANPALSVGTADISSFAGQTVELRFKSAASGKYLESGLDSIEFVSVPEPRVVVLTAIGSVAIGFCRRIRKTE